MSVFPQRDELLVLDARGENGAAELEELVDETGGLLDVALEDHESARIDAVHDRAVGELEALPRDLLDRVEGVEELADTPTEARAHLGALESRPDEVRAVPVREGAEARHHVVPLGVVGETVLEDTKVGGVVRVVRGEHEFLDLPDVRGAEHGEETADLSRGLAVVVGVHHGGDVQALAREERRDEGGRTATSVDDDDVQHGFLTRRERAGRRPRGAKVGRLCPRAGHGQRPGAEKGTPARASCSRGYPAVGGTAISPHAHADPHQGAIRSPSTCSRSRAFWVTNSRPLATAMLATCPSAKGSTLLAASCRARSPA